MKVAVLGCGPSGLVAAHAARMADCDVVVYSRKRKSEMFGAQYLHAPIPGMTETAPVTVHVDTMGSHEQYRRKVYAEQYDDVASVSTEDLPAMHDAWDIRSTYENLWQAYNDIVVDRGIDQEWLDMLVKTFDLVVSTVPAPVLCRSEHTFLSQDIWALGDAPERGVFVADNVHTARQIPSNTIVCNGEDIPQWYRAANVFGRMTVEWPLNSKDYVRPSAASRVTKPISTDCNCWPTIVRLGRYGQWTKGVLVHHVYDAALHFAASGTHG